LFLILRSLWTIEGGPFFAVLVFAKGGVRGFRHYMGRVASTTQCNSGAANCKTSSATYNYLSGETSVTYPSGNFTVTYGYDNVAAQLISATDSNGVIYANNPTYLASGAMQEFVSPNFSGNKYHADYNNRLQPTEIWAGSDKTHALFDKQYSYNAPNTTHMNNGNVYTVTNVIDDNRTQSFTYDALNRLRTAGDKANWANSYLYDPWGNLYQKVMGSLPKGENMTHVANNFNRLSEMQYDTAGNVTADDQGNTLVYDAENRVISVSNSVSGTTTYTYDAGGRRITKSNGGAVTNYWFGPSGEPLSETDASGNFTHYIFFGGQRLARNIPQPSSNPPDIKYYITDHLHSTAMFVDQAGASNSILDDNDFYPWGGVVPGVGKTTSNNHYKFTGKERDTESGLDYFGARYYTNATGRFMSPDWAAKPTSVPYADFGDPQSLNLYSYVRNSPIVRVDADGHMGSIMHAPENPAHGQDPFDDGDNEFRDAEINKYIGVLDKKQQKQAQQQSIQTTANVVYNETGGLADAPGLHDGRVAEATVFNHHRKAFPKNEQKLTKGQKKKMATDPNAKAVMADSLAAAREAVGRPDIGNHAITWDPSANAPHVPWMNSAYITESSGRMNIFGPFLNQAGGGSVPRGDWTYIVIMQDLTYREKMTVE
jgi:RHS repeat-associated protein